MSAAEFEFYFLQKELAAFDTLGWANCMAPRCYEDTSWATTDRGL